MSQIVILVIYHVQVYSPQILKDEKLDFRSKATVFLSEAFEAIKIETFILDGGRQSRDMVVEGHVRLAVLISRLTEAFKDDHNL